MLLRMSLSATRKRLGSRRTVEVGPSQSIVVEVHLLEAPGQQAAVMLRGVEPQGDAALRRHIEKVTLDTHIELLLRARACSRHPLSVYQLSPGRAGALKLERVVFERYHGLVYDWPRWESVDTPSSVEDACRLLQSQP